MDNNEAAKLLTKAYHAGKTVKVTFTKADGTERLMVVKRDREAEANLVGAGRHINREDKLRVTELLTDGTTQWRTVPLTRLHAVEVL